MNTMMLAPAWLTTLTTTLKNIVNPILGVVALVGVIYAIWVGVKFVKADSKEEREEAKAKLISVIIGIVVTGVLIALFYWLSWMFENGKFGFDSAIPTEMIGYFLHK